MDATANNTLLNPVDINRLTFRALNIDDFTRFSETWEKASGNMARTAQMLEKPLSTVAQRAYIYGTASAEDPRVLPFILGVPEHFGGKSPEAAGQAAKDSVVVRAPEDVAREVMGLLREVDLRISPRDDRELFTLVRATRQAFEKDADSQGKFSPARASSLLERAAGALEDIGTGLLRRGDAADGVKIVGFSQQALNGKAEERRVKNQMTH